MTTADDRDVDMSRTDDLPECVTVTTPTSTAAPVNSSLDSGSVLPAAVDTGEPVGAKPTMTKVPIKLTHANSFSTSLVTTSSVPAFGVETPHEEELRRRIDTELDRWGMDIFGCYDLAAGRPLTAIAYSVFEVSARGPPRLLCHTVFDLARNEVGDVHQNRFGRLLRSCRGNILRT